MVSHFRERALDSSKHQLESTVLLLAEHFDQSGYSGIEISGKLRTDVSRNVAWSRFTFRREPAPGIGTPIAGIELMGLHASRPLAVTEPCSPSRARPTRHPATAVRNHIAFDADSRSRLPVRAIELMQSSCP